MNNNLINFRDIGGYQAADGKKIKQGIFYRGGQITNLSNESINFLKNTCKIKTIYDFRSKNEIVKDPDTEINDINYTHIDILADINNSGASLESMIKNGGNIHDVMIETYSQLITSKSAQSGYRQFLTDILSVNQPAIFHCFAGKDRTGFAAAIILKILGVSDEDIFADYLLTNEARRAENERIINSLSTSLPKEILDSLHIALNVDKSYLRHAFDTINSEFGSFKNYLNTGLDLPDNFIDSFQTAFLEN